MNASSRIKELIIIGAAAAFVLAGTAWRIYGTVIKKQTSSQGTKAATSGGLTEGGWKRILTPEQYHVIRENGTEPPFSSPLDHENRPGTYVSADCGVPLFRSEQKYDSGTGWPSFWAPIDENALILIEDRDPILGTRIEVRDKACDGHLGHVFDDGPAPTGKRYCMNGDALRFVPDDPSASAP